ncbi:hypothetical protein CYMTET_35067, partial [Cymbomonas tetramitiformis]
VLRVLAGSAASVGSAVTCAIGGGRVASRVSQNGNVAPRRLGLDPNLLGRPEEVVCSPEVTPLPSNSTGAHQRWGCRRWIPPHLIYCLTTIEADPDKNSKSDWNGDVSSAVHTRAALPSAAYMLMEAALVAVVNHRSELLLVDVDSGDARVVARSPVRPPGNQAMWPFGHWLAFTCCSAPRIACIKLLDVSTGCCHAITTPVLMDSGPAWDPEGKYLYFIGAREYQPVHDELQPNGMAFPRGQRLYLLTLRKDTSNPLLRELRPVYSDDEEMKASSITAPVRRRYHDTTDQSLALHMARVHSVGCEPYQRPPSKS